MMNIPHEIILDIFNCCTSENNFLSLITVCLEWRDIIFTFSNKWKCLQLVKLLHDNNLIDQQPDHMATRCISSKEKKQYINNIIACTSQSKMLKVFQSFKEDVIDTLSDSSLNSIVFNGLTNKSNMFAIDDLMSKALKRVRGDIFLYPSGAHVYGKYPEDIYGRRCDYGISENYIVTVATWITSNKSSNWPRHGHPLLNIDENLPCELFMGKIEGDTIEFIIVVSGTSGTRLLSVGSFISGKYTQ